MNLKERIPGNVVLIIGVAGLALLVFLLYMQIGALQAAWQEVATETTSLNQVQLRLQGLLTAREQYSGLQELLHRYDSLMPAKPEEKALLNILETTAEETGTIFNQIQFDGRITQQGYVEMPIKLSFTGRYQGLINLIDHLQNGPRDIRIDEIKLAKGSQDQHELKVDITASSFYSSR